MSFRGESVDSATANLFTTHIGIALDAIANIESLTRRIASLEAGVGQEAMDRWAYEWAKGWQDAWDQLGEARTLVARVGRDVTLFDQARVAAGDIYLDAASGRAVMVARTTHVSWQNRSTEPAKQAVDALCAAMPEVVVARPERAPSPSRIEIPTDLAPTPDPTRWKAGVMLVLLGVVIYFCIKAS